MKSHHHSTPDLTSELSASASPLSSILREIATAVQESSIDNLWPFERLNLVKFRHKNEVVQDVRYYIEIG